MSLAYKCLTMTSLELTFMIFLSGSLTADNHTAVSVSSSGTSARRITQLAYILRIKQKSFLLR
jgi:hypothetical protein